LGPSNPDAAVGSSYVPSLPIIDFRRPSHRPSVDRPASSSTIRVPKSTKKAAPSYSPTLTPSSIFIPTSQLPLLDFSPPVTSPASAHQAVQSHLPPNLSAEHSPVPFARVHSPMPFARVLPPCPSRSTEPLRTPPQHVPNLPSIDSASVQWSTVQQHAVEELLKRFDPSAEVPPFSHLIAEKVNQYLYCHQWLHRTDAINVPGIG
jgi:hypothetical protein